jgi:hypothetical protein
VKAVLDGFAETAKSHYCLVEPKKAELLFIDSRSLEGLGLLSAYHDDEQKHFIIIGEGRPGLSDRMHHLKLPIDLRKLAKLLVGLHRHHMLDVAHANEARSEGAASITAAGLTCLA